MAVMNYRALGCSEVTISNGLTGSLKRPKTRAYKLSEANAIDEWKFLGAFPLSSD